MSGPEAAEHDPAREARNQVCRQRTFSAMSVAYFFQRTSWRVSALVGKVCAKRVAMRAALP